MALKINLVSKEIEKISKTNKIIHVLRIVSYSLFGVIGVTVFGAFGWLFFNSRQSVQVDKRVDNVLSMIEDQVELELDYRVYLSVLKEAEGIISSRQDFQAVVTELFRLLPPRSKITNLVFEEDIVLLEVELFGVTNMTRYIDELEVYEASDDMFEEIVVAEVRRSSVGVYIVQLELKIDKPS